MAPVDAERRLVPVLSPALVGHTELVTRLDPEDWRALLQQYFAAMVQPIQRYGGTVEKFIGDAIFAVFGVPRAHEDDAARAGRAAVEMREALERLNPPFTQELGVPLGLRIGIATGEAVTPAEAGEDRLGGGGVATPAGRLPRAAPPARGGGGSFFSWGRPGWASPGSPRNSGTASVPASGSSSGAATNSPRASATASSWNSCGSTWKSANSTRREMRGSSSPRRCSVSSLPQGKRSNRRWSISSGWTPPPSLSGRADWAPRMSAATCCVR